MTLTPRARRLDLKCGKGAISQGEKCTKGLATAPTPDKQKTIRNAARVAAVAGLTSLAIAAVVNRKKWTEAATDAWRRAKPFEPAHPPKGAEYLSQGNNGTVWISKDRKSIIKIPKNKRTLIGLDAEVAIQSTLRDRGVNTPEIYHYDKSKGVVHMQFMEGYKPLSSALKSSQQANNAAYARKFTEELSKVHAAGFAHGDLNYNNILIKDGDLAVIDYGFAGAVSKKGVGDLGNLIRMTKDLDPTYSAILKEEYKPIQAKITGSKPITPSDFSDYYARVNRRDTRRGDAVGTRLDLKCGKGAISKGEKCRKGPAISVAGVALGLGLAAGAIALRHRGRKLNATPERKAPNVPKDPPKPPASVTSPERRAVRQKQAQNLVDRVVKNNKKVSEEFGKIDFPANASRPITQRTDPSRVTSAAESFVSWTSAPGSSLSMSVEEAEKLIRKKGRIIDIYAIPDLDVAQAQADKVIGRNTLATKKVSEAYRRFYAQDRTDALRLDLKCGKGAISEGEKCHKGPSTQAKVAVGIGLTAGAIALGALALRRRPGAARPASTPSPESGTAPPPSGPPRLPGSTPRALLAPAPPRKSKTQRMRENTAAAINTAEGRIAQTAREEVRRIGQIGNTMAAAGEAAGMATKTTLRELRLRTEAARRRLEPGYRRGTQAKPQPPQRLAPGDDPVSLETIANMKPPELREFISSGRDPRTGQPRRRRAQGFGRRDNYVEHYAPVRLNLLR